MPYNIKQLGEKSVSIDFFIADPSKVENFCQYMYQIIHQCAFGNATISGNSQDM